MPRPYYPSDQAHNDARRKVKPHVKIHHSVKNHPKTADVWRDLEFRGMLVELWRIASERGAAHTGNWVTLEPGDIVSITCRTQYAHATRALRTLCARVEYATRTRGACLEIEVRKFAEKQGLTPHVARSNGAESGASPLPTTHIPPKAPVNGGGVSRSRRRLEAASAVYAAWSPETRQRFDRFWTAYAHKIAKAAATIAWEQLGPPDERLSETIISAALRQRQDWNRRRVPVDKTPHPATWLNAARWEDELPSPEAMAAQQQPRLVL